MGMHMPAPLQWVIGFLGLDAWPEADEDALRDMAKAYSKAAKGVSQSAQETLDAAGALGSVIEGDVHDAMKAYFDAVAGEGGLAGIVKNLEACGDACDQAADATLEGKIAYAANVAMLAATVASALGAGPFTFGGSTAAIPAAAAATRMSLWAILKRLVAKNLAAVAKDVAEKAAKKVAESGAKQFAKGFAVEAGKLAGKSGELAAKTGKDFAVKAGGQLNKTFIQLAEKKGGPFAKIMDTAVMRQPMAKGAVIGGLMETGKEGAMTAATGENHFDPTRILAQSAMSAVTSPVASRITGNPDFKQGLYTTTPVNMVLNTGLQTGIDAVAPDVGDAVRGTKLTEVAGATPGVSGVVENIEKSFASSGDDAPMSPLDIYDSNEGPPPQRGLNLDTSGERAH